MINQIAICGILKEVDQNDPRVRFIEVVRNYKNTKGIYDADLFPCLLWNKNSKGSFFTYKSGTIITLTGRIENIDGKVFIIVESYTYILSSDMSKVQRST